jgi:hypothetical protein
MSGVNSMYKQSAVQNLFLCWSEVQWDAIHTVPGISGSFEALCSKHMAQVTSTCCANNFKHWFHQATSNPNKSCCHCKLLKHIKHSEKTFSVKQRKVYFVSFASTIGEGIFRGGFLCFVNVPLFRRCVHEVIQVYLNHWFYMCLVWSCLLASFFRVGWGRSSDEGITRNASAFL